MYYVEEEKNELVKYEITLDEEKLKTIKREVLCNCGVIKHYDYVDLICHHDKNNAHVGNFSSRRLNHDMDYNYEYQYTYDYYEDTPLTKLIDELIKGNTKIYEAIKKYDIKNSDESRSKNEQEIKEKLYNLSYKAADDTTKRELENIKIKMDSFLLNKNRKNDIEYKNQVLECIDIKEITRISNNDWKQAKENIKKIDELINQTKKLLNIALFDNCNLENNVAVDGYQDAVVKIYQKK